jgi:hypothetical protein
MSANPPTKLPEAPDTRSAEEKAAEEKRNRFRPEMPQIPGVGSGARTPQSGFGGLDPQRLVQIAAIAAVVVVVGGIVLWRVKSSSHAAATPQADEDSAQQSAPAPIPEPVLQTPDPANVAATVDQLSKPWAAHKFTFVKPVTQDSIDAMVIRLPNGGLWAFSLQAPFGRCELEFVTDLDVLASKYNFNASHPMVVNPCDSTVYDPLKVGPLGGNTWARGEIVQGSSLRPPISIDVKVRGRSIIADSIE